MSHLTGTLIELEAVLIQVLPEEGPCGPPFTLQELADVASRYGDKPVSYWSIRRQWQTLRRNAHTRDSVAPLSADTTIYLSVTGARRLLRRVWRGRVPNKCKPSAN